MKAILYRICLAKYASKLVASGVENRWNSKGKFIIYTSSSLALACLENLVHRSGEGLQENFKTLIITIPSSVTVKEIKLSQLPVNWNKKYLNPFCQQLGDDWYGSGSSCILKVPSAIIPREYNYLINQQHPSFKLIPSPVKEKFLFDERSKNK